MVDCRWMPSDQAERTWCVSCRLAEETDWTNDNCGLKQQKSIQRFEWTMIWWEYDVKFLKFLKVQKQDWGTWLEKSPAGNHRGETGDIVGGSRNRAAPRGRSRPCLCFTDTADALGRALGIFRKPNKKSTISKWIIQSMSIYFDFGIFWGWCTIGLAALHSSEKLSSSMAFVSLSVRVYGVWWLKTFWNHEGRTVWYPLQFFFEVLKVMNLTTEKNPSVKSPTYEIYRQ